MHLAAKAPSKTGRVADGHHVKCAARRWSAPEEESGILSGFGDSAIQGQLLAFVS